ncbi:Hm13 [Acrasis kona]|uniref:Hm13 n=1 Tax=Acrasis kona TaxID=1008807 RepID=A0AAW2Z7I9_9EUKA
MVDQDLLVSYVALFTLAVIPIYFGAHQSLKPSKVEAMQAKDAYMFPVMGSIVLFSLYLAFKFLSKEWINFLMSGYFMVLGIGAVSAALEPFISKIVPYKWSQKKTKKEVKFTLPFYGEVKLSYVDIIGGFFGLVIGAWYITTKNWVANNIFGECFSLVSISLIQLGNFKVAAILLVGLFFYDIFWVFGTDVMVTVAKSFDAPIKVVYPRATGFSLLGLGDIVIPGIFIALMLRFDQHLAKKRGGKNQKLYFNIVFASYVVGLVTTILVLHVFKAGQPALLYIVPCVLGSVILTAVLKGDVKELLAYKDEDLIAKKEVKAEKAE